MSLALVQSIKASLVAQGVDLSGPCGAFAITKRVAWALRATGAGLLNKPSGNNCDAFAVDIVAYPDGRIRDILGDGGGANTPQWPEGDLEVVDASRYRVAVDPGDGSAPVPVPTPEPTPAPPVDLSEVLKKLDDLGQSNIALGIQVDGLEKAIERLTGKPDPTCPPVIFPPFPSYTGKVFGVPVKLTPEPK